VVEGSIRKAGNRVRVTAQLINAKNDKHIWAERYDRDLEDIFEVQDDVVRRITASLVARLAHERFERAQRRPPGDLRAYDLYLKARELFFNWNPADNQEARSLLETAIKMDRGYAAALALLSEVQLRMFLNGWSEAPLQELESALSNSQKAVEIDDQDSRVHTALGMAWIFHRDLDQAKHHFETALRLNPNDTRVLVYYSRQAMLEGRTDLALELCERATVLNPFGKYAWNIGMVQFAARDYLKARESVISIRNPPLAPLSILAGCHAMLDEAERARATAQRFFQAAQECASTSKISTQDEWLQYFKQRWPFKSEGDLTHLFEALSRAGILSGG
jgi:adenylate cyclase